MPLTLDTVPCRSDNYAFLIHDDASGATAVVDVPDAAPVLAALEARGWHLSDILITHHHGDHIDGVDALRAVTGAAVWGAAADQHRLPALDHSLAPGVAQHLLGETMTVIDVPGHTVGHIAYYFPKSALLFSGDSLMGLGCGRLFEGTPDQMWASLSHLAGLPDDVTVCSGHEYSQSNARFALSIDPNNAALQARATKIDRDRAAGKSTIPTELWLEKATNPFLRAADPSLKAALGLSNAADSAVFAQMRRMKDNF
ncbi:hydroxyacylglutathione hydrolase [Pseudoruegeria sp. SK021]|uniref:hydroxyacylglutathione hydrolase n=1 Tax=Pseudoruegeria sp. SK021 TaxID=1933035 RepID=UPI000A22C89F|nr:hydroxyacylglutathione hydrolase [Pseudoruegeria sp. SK021]OSP56477.1 hydroxyacylglutathione hydrolase [Pseudoruegeria sp. SK021]